MQKAETKKLIQKIAVLAVIIVLIGGVWLFKNGQQKESEKLNGAEPSQSTANLNEMEGYFPLNVTEEIDLEELKSYGLPIIIDFGADSCVPCKEMAPVLEKLNEEMAGEVIVLFVDVWKFGSLAEGFPIEVIPTQILIDAEGNPYMPSEDNSVQYLQYTYRDTGELAFTVHQGGITEEQLREALGEMGVKSND